MKELKNLNGVKMLSKSEQKAIKGGHFLKPIPCRTEADCQHPYGCAMGYCAQLS